MNRNEAAQMHDTYAPLVRKFDNLVKLEVTEITGQLFGKEFHLSVVDAVRTACINITIVDTKKKIQRTPYASSPLTILFCGHCLWH